MPLTQGRTYVPIEDLSPPYKDSKGLWAVNEQLYPESRGYIQYQFDSEAEARQWRKEVSTKSFD